MGSRPGVTHPVERRRLELSGVLQGVGFRPAIYRYAHSCGVVGFVQNTFSGAAIEVEGSSQLISAFEKGLMEILPDQARVIAIEGLAVAPTGVQSFVIAASAGERDGSIAGVLPDLAPCVCCLQELFDSTDRRYRFPFISCTDCGPRFSILERLPFDRDLTTMTDFVMCSQCQEEYGGVSDRRFHSQTNCCPVCGPEMLLQDVCGHEISAGDAAIAGAVEALHAGAILAVKGVGGYLLMVDASSDEAVQRLRDRKNRPDKPLAVLVPHSMQVVLESQLSVLELQLLQSPQTPIVLCDIDPGRLGLSAKVAIKVPQIGLMLPAAPLLALLSDDFGAALVATSGNSSGDPICFHDDEAFTVLAGVADLFLTHNRRIARALDDSVVRGVNSSIQIQRVGRGFAPLVIQHERHSKPALGVGAQTSTAVALGSSNAIVLSQHIGDLESVRSVESYWSTIDDLQSIYGSPLNDSICDLHPEYTTNRLVAESGHAISRVQHHVAHAMSCVLDNSVALPALAVVWDGAGFGPDSSIWGGEFFVCDEQDVVRVGSFRPFSLPGGAAAMRDCRRSAFGALCELAQSPAELLPAALQTAVSDNELRAWQSLICSDLNSPRTSSVGRLFDIVAGLAGICCMQSFEGQAALALESLLSEAQTEEAYPVSVYTEKGDAVELLRFDWESMVMELLSDLAQSTSAADISMKFHNFLVFTVCEMLDRVGLERVVLSGGCFQNRYLTERVIAQLEPAGYGVFCHRQIPAHDGGLAAGQLIAENHRLIF